MTFVFAKYARRDSPAERSGGALAYGIRQHQSKEEDRTLPNNGELELYVERNSWTDGDGPIPLLTHKGILDIIANSAPPSVVLRLRGHTITSGLISSQSSFSQVYGYFEVRVRAPGGKGIWPAFWLVAADESWPPEIDNLESIDHPGHVYVPTHSSAQSTVGVEARVIPHAFLTYRVSWDRNQVIFYKCGQEIGAQKTPPVFNKPTYMLANFEVGGNAAGLSDTSTYFAAILSIDYLRAYRFGP